MLRRSFSPTSGAGSLRSGVPGLRSLHRLLGRGPPASSGSWGPRLLGGLPHICLCLYSLLPLWLCVSLLVKTPLWGSKTHTQSRGDTWGIKVDLDLGSPLPNPLQTLPQPCRGRSGCHPHFINRK